MYFCIAEPLIGRVVYRGNNNANANGGVSYANANNAPSNSNTNVGSRLNYNQRNNNNRRTTKGTCFPTVEPREGSISNSSLRNCDNVAIYWTGKLKNHVYG